MKFILTIYLLFFLFQIYSQNRILSKIEMIEDIEIYVGSLNEKHIGLYRYNTKKEFKLYVDNISKSLPNSLRIQDFYKTISLINARIRCGHSSVKLHELIKDKNIYIPFSVYSINNKFYVYHDLTDPYLNIEHKEIISINGVSIRNILEEIRGYIPSDGFNNTRKKQFSENLFPIYYSRYFESDSTYTAVLNNKDTINIKALNYDKLILTSKERYKNNSIKNLQLINNKQNNYSYLKVSSFYVDTTVFRLKMDSVFNQIYNNSQSNLIIDLRGNTGGKIINENYLLSYLISKKINTYIKRKYLIKKRNKHIIYRRDYIINKTKNYKGNVYFLINGYVFSAASEFSAIAKYYNLGKFIGEETGGAEEGCNYGKKEVKLPNSRIICTIPYHQSIFKKTKSQKGRGIQPDYQIVYTKSDYMNSTDTVLNFTISLINNSN